MAKFIVSAHQAQWHVENDKGRIRLKFDVVKDMKTVTLKGCAEFLVMLTMLQSQKRVIYDSSTKVLSTDW